MAIQLANLCTPRLNIFDYILSLWLFETIKQEQDNATSDRRISDIKRGPVIVVAVVMKEQEVDHITQSEPIEEIA